MVYDTATRIMVVTVGGRQAAHAKSHGLDTREILEELGSRHMVGGQEDMIIDVALDIKRKKSEK